MQFCGGLGWAGQGQTDNKNGVVMGIQATGHVSQTMVLRLFYSPQKRLPQPAPPRFWMGSLLSQPAQDMYRWNNMSLFLQPPGVCSPNSQPPVVFLGRLSASGTAPTPAPSPHPHHPHLPHCCLWMDMHVCGSWSANNGSETDLWFWGWRRLVRGGGLSISLYSTGHFGMNVLCLLLWNTFSLAFSLLCLNSPKLGRDKTPIKTNKPGGQLAALDRAGRQCLCFAAGFTQTHRKRKHTQEGKPLFSPVWL